MLTICVVQANFDWCFVNTLRLSQHEKSATNEYIGAGPHRARVNEVLLLHLKMLHICMKLWNSCPCPQVNA